MPARAIDAKQEQDVTTLDWLLDSDPAIRWQAMRDLTDASAATCATERARVAHEGIGARILSTQGAEDRGIATILLTGCPPSSCCNSCARPASTPLTLR